MFKQAHYFQVLVALSVLVLPCFAASAEGNCPPGHYPVGGQGVMGCAPISNYGGAQPGQPQQPAVDPGRYEARWGAFALSDTTTDAGVAADEVSRSAAVATALGKCSRNGVKDCRVILDYSSQCAAWVVPPADVPGAKVGLGVGKTAEAAIGDGLMKCKPAAGGTCTVAYSGCSLPKYIR